MLRSLSAVNFALIEKAYVEFDRGLNVLTGETGAGKSILIDALSAILGSRVSTDLIRANCDYFRVEAVFDITGQNLVQTLIDEHGIPIEDDMTIIISRRLSRSGKNTAIVNGCHVPLSFLRLIGGRLVDMHGQHENQQLLNPESHLRLLDSFEPGIKPLLLRYKTQYQTWKQIRHELTETEKSSRDRIQRIDMLTWQTQEIAAASLTPGEDSELEREISILDNAEKIAESISTTYRLLSQGKQGAPSILSMLAEVRKELDSVVKYDAELEARLNVVAECIYQLEEVAADLRDYYERIDFNPQKLAKYQERADLITKLKKKYGATIEDVLTYNRQALEELNQICDYDQRVADLQKRLQTSEKDLAETAQELDRLRHKVAKEFAEQVRVNLAELGMPKAVFEVVVSTLSEFGESGCTDAVFSFSANPGEDPKPLHKIASGGELSRIALAVKSVCASREDAAVMVLDEVDSGVGGQTGQMIAEKIGMVANRIQVLCITHLPQIACMADRNISVAKTIEGDRTVTKVQVLDEPQKLIDIARMLSGDVTEVALANAAQMVETAAKKKEKWKK